MNVEENRRVAEISPLCMQCAVARQAVQLVKCSNSDSFPFFTRYIHQTCAVKTEVSLNTMPFHSRDLNSDLKRSLLQPY